VELAIQIPLLMVLLFGAVEIGRVFYVYHTLQKALRGLETGLDGLAPQMTLPLSDEAQDRLAYELRAPGADRLLYTADAFRAGWSFERIAELTVCGGFLGTWPLIAETPQARSYVDALRYTADHQTSQRGSHIHTVICAALDGECGGSATWPSPLANLYWFFSADVVAETNLLLRHIESARSMWEIAATVEAVRKSIPLKSRSAIPI